MLYLGLYTGAFPACFYTVSGFKAHFSRLLRYFSSFRKFSAPILNPNICFVRIFPLTGIVSIWYLLRRMEGTVSTPFLTRERNSNCHVLRNRWDRALSWAALVTYTRLVLFEIFGWHWSLYGQFSHLFLGKDARTFPVLFAREELFGWFPALIFFVIMFVRYR